MTTSRRWNHGVLPLGSGRYLVRVRADRPDGRSVKNGKLRRKQSTIKRVVVAASALEARVAREKLRGDVRAIARGERRAAGQVPTLDEFKRTWLKSLETNGSKPGTVTSYRKRLDGHVLPSLGEMHLDKITPGLVQRLFNDLSKEGRAPLYVRGVFTALRAMLRDAAHDLEMPVLRTICDDIRLPAPKRVTISAAEPNTAPPDELLRLLDIARAHGAEIHAVVAVLALTGLRLGEVLALKWEDIDEDRSVVRVVRGISDSLVVDEPKNENAVRQAPLTPTMRQVLGTHRQESLRNQFDALPEGWVFPRRWGQGPRSATWARGMVHAVAKEAGLTHRLSPHGFRRAWIDVARGASLDPIVVRRVVGHADERTRDWYSTVVAREIAQAGVQVEAAIIGKCGPESGPTHDPDDGRIATAGSKNG